MKYGIYIDVFTFHNLFMDILALWITGEILHENAKLTRICIMASAASLTGTLLFILLPEYMLYQLLVHFFLNPVMMYLVFRTKDKKRFLEEWAVCYLVILFLGGSMQWFYVELAKMKHPGICILLTMIGVIVLLCMVEQKKRITQKVYPVKICDKGRELNLQAYYDSGNLLMDPFFHEPVSIIDEESIRHIMNENMPVRLIPFQSLGTENGMIQVVTLEEMEIQAKKEVIKVKPAVVGVGKRSLFQDAGYKMILNEKILRK